MNDTTTRGDVKIAGAGTVATGSYRDVRVSGSATLTGEIECVLLKVDGAADGRGTIKAERIAVSGGMKFDGDVETGVLKISGSAWYGGAVRAGEMRVAGTADVRADLASDVVEVQGALTVHGDCQAERFVAQGAFTVDGLLNAGVVDIHLHGTSRAREIGGEAITVRYAPFPLQRIVAMFLTNQGRLTAEIIEGDDVRLEQTKVRVVRGKRVAIGTGCEVELVEYTESFEQASDARVKTARKTGDGSDAATSEEDV